MIRKLSTQFLCKLAFENERVQHIICENLGFSPVLGEKICINSMPETLREQLKRNPGIYIYIYIYARNVGKNEREY